MKFEYYQGKDKVCYDKVGPFQRQQWYWRLRAANGRIVADGAEGYASKRNVLRAIQRVRLLVSGSLARDWRDVIVEVPGSGD